MNKDNETIRIKGKIYNKTTGELIKPTIAPQAMLLKPKKPLKVMDIARPIKRPNTIETITKINQTTVSKKAISLSPAPRATKSGEPKDESTQKNKSLNEPNFQKMVEKNQKSKNKKNWKRSISIIFITVTVFVLGCFFAYRYIPTVSIGLAKLKLDDLRASYPEYLPDNFKLTKPAEINQQDELMLSFTDGQNVYKLKQTNSNWDSSALKADIEKVFSNQITTINERGLTIFIFDNQARWVNGGILYSFIGEASLPASEIRKIATSM